MYSTCIYSVYSYCNSSYVQYIQCIATCKSLDFQEDNFTCVHTVYTPYTIVVMVYIHTVRTSSSSFSGMLAGGGGGGGCASGGESIIPRNTAGAALTLNGLPSDPATINEN